MSTTTYTSLTSTPRKRLSRRDGPHSVSNVAQVPLSLASSKELTASDQPRSPDNNPCLHNLNMSALQRQYKPHLIVLLILLFTCLVLSAPSALNQTIHKGGRFGGGGGGGVRIGNLSVGQKVGIGLGIGFAVILGGVMGWCHCNA